MPILMFDRHFMHRPDMISFRTIGYTSNDIA